MKRIAFIFIWVLLTTQVHAGTFDWIDDWDTADRLLLAGYSTVLFIDWGQTRMIAENPDDYYETRNDWIGKHPSTGTVDTVIIGSYLINLFVANTLEGYWRKGYLSLFILEHGIAIFNSRKIGLVMTFNF